MLPWGAGWLAVLACGVCGGLAGGCFSSTLVWFAQRRPGRGRGARSAAIRWCSRRLCGLGIAVLGIAERGRHVRNRLCPGARVGRLAGACVPDGFFALKFAASVLSYVSGIPGGIFAPSLAVGAGLGHAIAAVYPGGAGRVRSCCWGWWRISAASCRRRSRPTVIVMEMTEDGRVTVPLMAAALLAYLDVPPGVPASRSMPPWPTGSRRQGGAAPRATAARATAPPDLKFLDT